MILRKSSFLPIAHRGGNTDFAENTFEAFERARELGYQCVELDVQLSSDGVVYVYHDANFKRLLHLDKKFSETSSDEIDTFLINGKYKIPRLVDIFELFPDFAFNIDAKSWDVSEPLAKIIRASNALSRVHIASFSDRRVRYLSKLLNNQVKTVAGVSQVIKFVFGFLTGVRFKFSADFIQVPESKFGIKLVTARAINYAHMAGIFIHVWTINDEEKMRSLIELGVDGIITDECKKLKDVLEKSI